MPKRIAPEVPRHLVPDRPLGEAVSYDGKLLLSDPNVTVLVADADYADVTIQLQLRGAKRWVHYEGEKG